MAGKTKRVALVVRRGALRRFDTLKKKTAELPVDVLWDRRQEDRRTSMKETPAQRRQRERRQAPPFTWDLADFVVVEDETPARPSAKRKKKS